jgi:hypothetical protein
MFLLRVGIPSKDLADHLSFRWIHTYTTRIARTFSIQNVAIECLGPGQKLPRTQLGQPSPTHAVSDKRTLVFRHSAPDLENKLVMWIITHRSIQKLDLAPLALQLLQNQGLVDILPSQTIGCSNQDQFKLSHSCPITEAVQARAAQLGATVSVVSENMFFAQDPSLSDDVSAQAFQLLLNRLVSLLV